MVSTLSARHGCTVSAYWLSRLVNRSCCQRNSSPLIAPVFSSFSSSVLWFFGPSLHRHYAASPLLRPLLTSPPLSRKRSPQVRCRICPLVPTGSTQCVLMTFGLRCYQPACRPHPASLPVRVPTVESLLPASFSFTSRLRLAVHYGCRHRLRLAPFIQQDSAHAGHTGADFRSAMTAFVPASLPNARLKAVVARRSRAPPRETR
jgi:hypothetical protein